MFNQKGSATYWAILIVITIIALAILISLWPKGKDFETATGLVDVKFWREMRSKVITEVEKIKIENWIRENDLNQYGDSKDTMYIGGTPLFNEATRERISRWEYIIKNHPDKPWNK